MQQHNQDLKHLQIDIILNNNNIGPDFSPHWEALQGAPVHRLELKNNNLSSDIIERLAVCVPGTSLFRVDVGFEHKQLNEALEKNRWQLKLTPYYLQRFQNLPAERKPVFENVSYPGSIKINQNLMIAW